MPPITLTAPSNAIRMYLSPLYTKLGFADQIASLLLTLVALSFLPQYARILMRRDCVGIAPSYILCNLIAATEQFAFGLHFLVSNGDIEDSIVATPPKLGDWLNLAQLTIVWLCHLVFFGLFLHYATCRFSTKAGLSAAYAAFLMISVTPVIFEAMLPPSGTNPNGDRRWLSAWLEFTHSILINPIVTAIAVAALLPQARMTRARSDPGALSVWSLGAQALIFMPVAFYWCLRMTIPVGVPFLVWYQLVGWAAVDNLIFAIVQAVLWRTCGGPGMRLSVAIQSELVF